MIKLIKKWWSSFAHLLSGHFAQLLFSLILLFIFRPYDRGHIYMAVWQVFFVIVFFSAIFNCKHSKRTRMFSAYFGIPAIIIQWINLFAQNKMLTVIFLVFMILFTFIITSSIINRVILNARVKLETLRGVVCAYFMIAFGFSFIYFLIDLITPGSFHISPDLGASFSHTRYLSEMMYFSFVTLLSIGYGDITAIKDVGQTFTILEGIIGQFYIAILVSRLVAVYSFFEHKLHLVKSPVKKSEKK